MWATPALKRSNWHLKEMKISRSEPTLNGHLGELCLTQNKCISNLQFRFLLNSLRWYSVQGVDLVNDAWKCEEEVQRRPRKPRTMSDSWTSMLVVFIQISHSALLPQQHRSQGKSGSKRVRFEENYCWQRKFKYSVIILFVTAQICTPQSTVLSMRKCCRLAHAPRILHGMPYDKSTKKLRNCPKI